MYSAVRYLSQDPYYLYNGPNAKPPKSWDRVKTFIYACALHAAEDENERLKVQVKAAGAGGALKQM